MALPNVNKAKRSKNFTKEELEILVDGMIEFKNVLFAEQNNAITNDMKARKKEEILKRINTVAEQPRTLGQIRKKWKDLSAVVKKKESERRAALRKTGGGAKPKDLTELEEKVVSLLRDTKIAGVQGGFDSSVAYAEVQAVEAVDTQTLETQGSVVPMLSPVLDQDVNPNKESWSIDLSDISALTADQDAATCTTLNVVYPGCSWYADQSAMEPSDDARSKSKANQHGTKKRKHEESDEDFVSAILKVENEKLIAQQEIAATLKEILKCLRTITSKDDN